LIHESGGRSRSQRTVEEIEELLQREMEGLDPEEKAALQVLMAELKEGQIKGGMYEALHKSEYKTQPVDMEQFIKDPYFLGHTCEGIYPRLLDDLTELFSGGYHESVWTGSIGYGKTFAASIGVCRVLYEISCLRDPHATFSLAKDSNIAVICLSVNEVLAVKVAFENIATKIKASPYFQKNFAFTPTKKELRFPHNVWVAARATTDTSALGLNAVSALLDETNFMPTKGKEAARMGYVDHAEVIYNSVQRRMKSRFQRKGKLPGMLFVVSSKKTSDDFTARRVRAAREDPTVFVRDYALWDVKPENFSNVKFQVIVGNEQTPSKILEPSEVEVLRAKPVEGTVLLDVPEDFRSDFESDLEGSIRDLAGCATVSISPFIQRREKIHEAVEQDKRLFGDKRHPFSTYNYDPSKGGTFLWEKMIRMTEERGISGIPAILNKPIINPTAHRHVHIDPALRNDALGFCMSHISGWKDVIRRSEQGQYMERAPVYVVDLILQVVPPAGDEIILGDIRRLIYELSAHGYTINNVSLDSFQSRDTLQQLQQKGYNAEMVSVDTSMEPYENLKTALYENRVFCYEYLPLIKELQQLEKDSLRRKVDHPPKGCFVGRTRVPLLDGSFPQIDELCGKEVWAYSSTPEGRIVPGRARGRLTKYVTELVDVVLDNGAVERCTPEHLWMLRDGSYKEARSLRPGTDRLMPINRVWPVNGGYERVTDRDGRRTLTHHMVWSAAHGDVPEEHCVHHLNHIKTDNRPENLVLEPLTEHARSHTALRHQTDPAWREKLYAGAQVFNLSEDGRQKHSDALKRIHAGMTAEDWQALARQKEAFRSDIDRASLEAVRSDPEAQTANAVARILGCGRNVVVRVLREHGFESWDEFQVASPGENHKVRAVIPVTLAEPVPVYDLEVDEWSNFALSSGVFVHNSKDCSDALAGCLYTLFTRRVNAPLPMLKGLSVYGDAWLPEQRQAEMAGDRSAALNKDLKDYGMLPPFLTGTGNGSW